MANDYIAVKDRAKTILIDIDGVLFRQDNFWPDIEKINQPLPGAKEKLTEWHMRGYRIVLLTARPEPRRQLTVRQLDEAHFLYDHLIMGLPTGQRVLINDFKPEQADLEMAIAINLIRDEGMERLE